MSIFKLPHKEQLWSLATQKQLSPECKRFSLFSRPFVLAHLLTLQIRFLTSRTGLLIVACSAFLSTSEAVATTVYKDTWTLTGPPSSTQYGFVSRESSANGSLKIQIQTTSNFPGRWRPDEEKCKDHSGQDSGSYEETELSDKPPIMYVPGLMISTFANLYKNGGTSLMGGYPYCNNPVGDRWGIQGHGEDILGPCEPVDHTREVTWRGIVEIQATGTMRLKDNTDPAEAHVVTGGTARLETSGGKSGFISNVQSVSHQRTVSGTISGSASIDASGTGVGANITGSVSKTVPIGGNTYLFATDTIHLEIIETKQRSCGLEEWIKTDTEAYLKWSLDNVETLNAIIRVNVIELDVSAGPCVPEPATALLLGLGGLALLRRR